MKEPIKTMKEPPNRTTTIMKEMKNPSTKMKETIDPQTTMRGTTNRNTKLSHATKKTATNDQATTNHTNISDNHLKGIPHVHNKNEITTKNQECYKSKVALTTKSNLASFARSTSRNATSSGHVPAATFQCT